MAVWRRGASSPFPLTIEDANREHCNSSVVHYRIGEPSLSKGGSTATVRWSSAIADDALVGFEPPRPRTIDDRPEPTNLPFVTVVFSGT
jgi:hypothetical protein